MAVPGLVTPVGFGEKLVVLTIFAFLVKWLTGSTGLAIAIAVAAVVLQMMIIKRHHNFWKNLGIAGPPPTFWIGHLGDVGRDGMHGCDMRWKKEYGSIYGVYMLSQPELIVSDPDLIKQILIKDFHVFTNRRAITGSGKSNWQEGSGSMLNFMLTLLNDDQWKNARRTITPTFTAGKMKHMTPAVHYCMKTVMEILKEDAEGNKPLKVHELFGAFALDVIAIAAFGQEIDTLRNPDHLFVKYSKEIGEMNLANPKMMLSFLFPTTFGLLDKKLGYLLMFREGQDYFVNTLSKIIKERRANPLRKQDFLQLLLNAADEGKDSTDQDKDEAIDHDFGGQKIKLTDFEIMAHSFLFLVAGYGTTANTMSYCAYELARHQDIQDKCREEINMVVGDEEVTWDHVQNKLPYLDSVVMETLRFYPPAARFDRNCGENYQLTEGITLPKGTAVSIPAYAIHHSEEFYPDPETFDPDRFLPEERAKRNPLLFLAFGAGPRNCIGMRFAQMEMKLCLATLLRKFRLVLREETEKAPLKLNSVAVMKPINPIILGVEEV